MFKTMNTDGFLGTGDSEGGGRSGLSHAGLFLSHTLSLTQGEPLKTTHNSQTNEKERHHTNPDMALQQVGYIIPSLSPPFPLSYSSRNKRPKQHTFRRWTTFWRPFSSAYLCTTTRHLHRTSGWGCRSLFPLVCLFRHNHFKGRQAGRTSISHNTKRQQKKRGEG